MTWLSYRAGWLDFIPRGAKMPARSATLVSATLMSPRTGGAEDLRGRREAQGERLPSPKQLECLLNVHAAEDHITRPDDVAHGRVLRDTNLDPPEEAPRPADFHDLA